MAHGERLAGTARMNEPRKQTIWAISSGSYSDYGVHLLCETEEQAKQAVAAMGGDYRVEGFDYFPIGSGPGVYRWFRATGLEGSLDVRVSEWRAFGQAPLRPRVRKSVWRDNAPSVLIEATCRDRTAAIKAVKDRLIQRKALGPWVTPEPRDLDLLRLKQV